MKEHGKEYIPKYIHFEVLPFLWQNTDSLQKFWKIRKSLEKLTITSNPTLQR